MRIRIERWLLDPLRLWPMIFMVQAAVWYFGFPERPTIPGAAPRFYSTDAGIRYAVLFLALVIGIVSGRFIAWMGDRYEGDRLPLATRLRIWRRMAAVGVVLASIGELVYARALLLNPALVGKALVSGDFAMIAEIVNAQQVTGLSSLINLFTVPTAIYALLSFDPRLPKRIRRSFIMRLILLGGIVVTHALVLSARMMAIYFVAILAAAYLLQRPQKTLRLRGLAIGATLVLAIVWAGSTLRDGGRRVAYTGYSYLHPDTQRYVADTLMQGYFGADFNNTLVFLNCETMGSYIYTTMFRTIAYKFGVRFTLNDCFPEMDSVYGTMNALALWWEDMGWWATILAWIVGGWVSYLYVSATHRRDPTAAILFLISYPGIYSTIRINYFFLTIYIIPLLYVVGSLTLRRFVLWTTGPTRSRAVAGRPRPA